MIVIVRTGYLQPPPDSPAAPGCSWAATQPRGALPAAAWGRRCQWGAGAGSIACLRLSARPCAACPSPRGRRRMSRVGIGKWSRWGARWRCRRLRGDGGARQGSRGVWLAGQMGAGLPAEQLSAGTIAPGFSCLHPRASDHPSHPAHIMAGFWFSFDTLSPDAGQHWDGTELTMAMRDWCRAAGCS